MIVAKWREGFAGLFHGANAQKVADEILSSIELPKNKQNKGGMTYLKGNWRNG